MRPNLFTICYEIDPMSAPQGEDVPALQRLYDNIWLLALAAIVFFVLSYVAWGVFDIVTVQPR